MKKANLLLALLLLFLALPALAQRSFNQNLWQAKTPNKNGLQDTAYIKVYLPDAKRATGRAVVI